MVPIDEALIKIYQTWPSNQDFLDDLKDRLTVAQPIPLVPFVGAGLSMPMGFPSWRSFLTGLRVLKSSLITLAFVQRKMIRGVL